MNGTGDHLLAGARLALDEHGRVAVGQVADQLEDCQHGRTLAENVVERVAVLQLAAQRSYLVLKRALAQGALDHHAELSRSIGLGRKS